MQGNAAWLCMRDDWATYRFVIYDCRVAFDVTTLLASGPKPARFSAFLFMLKSAYLIKLI